MVSASAVTVNGVNITSEEIDFEVQYHPAESLFSAKYEATQALVIKELLFQRAVDLNLCERDSFKDLDNLDSVLESLFEQEIIVPDADEETCQRFYNNNQISFLLHLYLKRRIFYTLHQRMMKMRVILH